MLRKDVWHSGIVGGEGNVRVHGGIFEAWAFQTTTTLWYPPATKEGTNLKAYKKAFDAVHNKDPIDHKSAIRMVSDTQGQQLDQMYLNLCKLFLYARLPTVDGGK